MIRSGGRAVERELHRRHRAADLDLDRIDARDQTEQEGDEGDHGGASPCPDGAPRPAISTQAGGGRGGRERDRLRQVAAVEPDDLLAVELVPQPAHGVAQPGAGRDVLDRSPGLGERRLLPVQAPDEERDVDRLQIAPHDRRAVVAGIDDVLRPSIRITARRWFSVAACRPATATASAMRSASRRRPVLPQPLVDQELEEAAVRRPERPDRAGTGRPGSGSRERGRPPARGTGRCPAGPSGMSLR